jgi:peroxiredoxin
MHAYRDQYAQIFKDGQNVILIGISADPVDTLAAWEHDDQMQFLMASDKDQAVGKAYGAIRGNMDNRNLFVVGPDGKIAYHAVPFREVDPTAYTELTAAVEKIAGDPTRR